MRGVIAIFLGPKAWSVDGEVTSVFLHIIVLGDFWTKTRLFIGVETLLKGYATADAGGRFACIFIAGFYLD